MKDIKQVHADNPVQINITRWLLFSVCLPRHPASCLLLPCSAVPYETKVVALSDLTTQNKVAYILWTPKRLANDPSCTDFTCPLNFVAGRIALLILHLVKRSQWESNREGDWTNTGRHNKMLLFLMNFIKRLWKKDLETPPRFWASHPHILWISSFLLSLKKCLATKFNLNFTLNFIKVKTQFVVDIHFLPHSHVEIYYFS